MSFSGTKDRSEVLGYGLDIDHLPCHKLRLLLSVLLLIFSSATIGMYKNIINARLAKMLDKSKIKEESNQKYLLKKLLQDSDNLEKFYSDKEYRNKLESAARYPSSEYFELGILALMLC